MGPQLYRCGNGETPLEPPEREDCFNGAATLSLRKRSRGGTNRPRPQSRFNGAATLSLRKLISDAPAILGFHWLQWGRNFIVAETLASVWAWCRVSVLQWGRNFIVAETCLLSCSISARYACFNGAATLSLRKLHCHDVVWKNSDSFNGAATLSLRKPGKSYGACLARKVASMGPQLYRCGNFIAMMLSGKIAIASMGPQLYRCGNLARVTAPAWPERLLQWGRNFIVAETKKGGGIPYLIFYASMGPQLYRFIPLA